MTSVTDGNLLVERSAYPGKTIPHIAETGFKQTSRAFQVTGFALFNQFAFVHDTTKAPGMDMQLMSAALKSSAHVPVILEGRPGTMNFWSTQPKAFTQEQAALMKSLSVEVAKAK